MTSPPEPVAVFLPVVVALPTKLVTIVIHGLALLLVIHFIQLERSHPLQDFASGELSPAFAFIL